MKVISLKTGQEIHGVIYKNNPSQIQEILNEPKVLRWHSTFEECQKYIEPSLITFNLCYFQKSDMDNDENSYLFNKVPSNRCVVGVFNEIGGTNHIYILRDANNDIIVLNKNNLEGITVRNFVEDFLLIN